MVLRAGLTGPGSIFIKSTRYFVIEENAQHRAFATCVQKDYPTIVIAAVDSDRCQVPVIRLTETPERRYIRVSEGPRFYQEITCR